MIVARAICPRCRRPQSACICRWITPVANRVPVLILQHPLEAGEAKNSARLLQLSLADSRIEVGEAFEPARLQALLQRSPRRSVLLYPADAEAAAADNVDNANPAPEPELLQLVVLDATWRKSRKMLHLNPLLRQLPRLALTAAPPSRYRIRRAHAPGQLATLEAVCQALMMLDGAAAQPGYAALLQAFDGFVAQQLGYRADAGRCGS